MSYVADKLIYILELDTRKFEVNSRKAERSVDRLAGSIRGTLLKAVAAVGAGFSAWKLGNIAKDATLVAARTQVLKTVLEQVGKVSGYSAGELAQQEAAIKSLGITTQASRQLMIRFMQSQLDVADAAKIARAAQNLAVIANVDSSQAAMTLTEAISAQRPILLKQFGIVKDLNEVYKDQAELLGKSVQDLTQLEKKQAFLNVVLKEAGKVAGSYEAAMRDAGKQLTSFPRYIEETQNAIGERFQPALKAVLTTAKGFLETVKELFQTTRMEVADFYTSFEKFERGSEATLKLADRYDELASKTELNSDEQRELENVIDSLANTMPSVISKWDEASKAIGINTEQLRENLRAQRASFRVEEQEKIESWKKAWQGLETEISGIQSKIYQEERKALQQAEQILPAHRLFGDHAPIIAQSKAYQDLGEKLATLKDKQRDYLAVLSQGYDSVNNYDRAVKELGETLADDLLAYQEDALESATARDVQRNTQDAAQQAIQQDKVIYEARLDVMREMGLIENREWLAVLERRLGETKQGSSEYVSIWKNAFELAYQEALTFAQGLPPLPSNVQQQQESLFADPHAVGEEWKRQAEEIWGDFETRGMSAVEEIDDSMQDMIQAIYPAANFVFGRISQELQSLMNNVMASISGFAQGGVSGISAGIANALSGVMSLFSDSSDRLVLSQRELTEAVERNSDALLRGTTNELDDQLQSLRAFINQMNEGFEGPIDYLVALEKLRQEGFDIPKNLSGEQLREFVEGLLAELEGGLGFYEDILGARSFEDMLRTLGVTGGYKPGEGFTLEGLGFDEATRAIEYWAEIFDLSTEQQLELYEQLKRTLEASGDYSYEELLRINEIIDRLRDSLEEASGDTQTFRSVTTITESQANLMLGQLNTLAEINRAGNRILETMLARMDSGLGGFRGGNPSTYIIQHQYYGGRPSNTVSSSIGSQLINEIQSRGKSVFSM